MARTHIVGSLIGGALGDAIGLPYEGLSPRRAARMLGPPDRHRFLFGRGMVSDDTEHACMTAQALVESAGDVPVFRNRLAWRLRLWLLALPAGIGFATLRSLLRLWIGFGPERSGVFSAGNGPAMRAPVLGAAVDDPEALKALVRASTRITHSDPKAEAGALAIALAARIARRGDPDPGAALHRDLDRGAGPEGAELTALIAKAVEAARTGKSTGEFVESIGLGRGVSGYVYHTVPVAVHAWLSHPRDLRAAVSGVVACGGDADTTGAIVGGIVGAGVGREGIPEDWLAGLMEWPRSAAWMERLGAQVAESLESRRAVRAVRLPAPAVLVRNLLFLGAVLGHGFRRLLPPYA